MDFIKIVFCCMIVFDFFATVCNEKEKTIGELIFKIVLFFLFVVLVAERAFF